MRERPALGAGGLSWGLWLPTNKLEESYWIAHHVQCAKQDTFFFAAFLLTHALHFFRVTPVETQALFSVGAVCLPLTGLVLQWRAPSFYLRHREILVFATHLAVTHIRAAVVAAMRIQVAVGWRPGGASVDPEEPLLSLLLSFALMSGVLFRVLESLGLQLPAPQQAAIALVYIIDHTLLGWEGIRMASSNYAFHVYQRLYDAVDSTFGYALAPAAPLAAGPTACSSCPALVLWLWICLTGGVVLPLYLLVAVERAGKLQWLAQLRAREARDGGGGSSSGSGTAPAPAAAAAARPAAAALEGGGLLAADPAAAAWAGPPVWLQHAAAVVLLAALCWAAAGTAALVVAPRVLSRESYLLQCPPRMPSPYANAARVHG